MNRHLVIRVGAILPTAAATAAEPKNQPHPQRCRLLCQLVQLCQRRPVWRI